MRSLHHLRIAVAGGGAFGLSVAALAVQAGARVTVFEPCPLGANASGVAAGMLAPTLEAALEDGGPLHHAVFRQAYAAWPDFAARLRLPPLVELGSGALYCGLPEAVERLVTRLDALGAPARRLSGPEARALQPGLVREEGAGALWIEQDGRLDPMIVLAALQAFVRAGGGEIVDAPCPGLPAVGYDATVIAAGYESRRWADRVPVLETLQPIKGHVLHYQAGPASGPTVRSEAGYLAPQRRGAVFGATMEPDRDDLAHDPAAIATLHDAAAARLVPELAQTPFIARTGVRAATPDEFPLVGAAGEGLHLAVGARRNGWLLAPLTARLVLDGLQGASALPAFDPLRFERRGQIEDGGSP